MTARDLYINILGREPDIQAIKQYGCVDRLSTDIFLNLQKALEKSPEYAAQSSP